MLLFFWLPFVSPPTLLLSLPLALPFALLLALPLALQLVLQRCPRESSVTQVFCFVNTSNRETMTICFPVLLVVLGQDRFRASRALLTEMGRIDGL